MSTVGRAYCMCGSSVSIDVKKPFKVFALWLLSEMCLPSISISVIIDNYFIKCLV